MNNNQKELSLGNFCRILKELSLNKSFAGQQDIFYAIFGVDDISDSTINNYCIGYRSIGSSFKQSYMKRKNYPNSEFDESMITLYSILKGRVYSQNSHDEIKELLKDGMVKKLCLELYNLAKNDESVSPEFTKKIYNLIKTEDIYSTLCEILIYIVLEKKQPIYVDKTKRELFEDILNNTNISMNDLQKFVTIQLQDGINYIYSLKNLAKEGNPYASFELGDMEYTGRMTGRARYIKAFEYFQVAALKNHPRACWLIAKMILDGKIGNKSREDIKKAHKYLKVAEQLGSIAALNSIGICYLNGIGKKVSEVKAIEYFEKAANSNYVYAHNNLGKIYEKKGKLEEAYKHYLFSANLKESWASNKLGQWYLFGLYIEENHKKAYNYFNQALDVPMNILNYWAYYNLARYFYKEGNYEANIEKDINKAIDYFEKCKDHGIEEAYEELIFIYIDLYKENQKEEYLNKINEYIKEFSVKKMYDEKINKIEEALNSIKKDVIIVKKKEMNRKSENMKKGFTLVELLGVIIILGIIGAIAIPIVQNSIKESGVNACKMQVESFIKAAKNYTSQNPYKTYNSVTLSKLQEEGFLKSGEIKNPKGGTFSLSSIVTITKNESGAYLYTYNYDCES